VNALFERLRRPHHARSYGFFNPNHENLRQEPHEDFEAYKIIKVTCRGCQEILPIAFNFIRRKD